MVEIRRYLETRFWAVHRVHFCVHLIFVAGYTLIVIYGKFQRKCIILGVKMELNRIFNVFQLNQQNCSKIPADTAHTLKHLVWLDKIWKKINRLL